MVAWGEKIWVQGLNASSLAIDFQYHGLQLRLQHVFNFGDIAIARESSRPYVRSAHLALSCTNRLTISERETGLAIIGE
jgi:hypothetical protein